jgi:hypothetical protein
MANRKISDLTALTAPATGDLLPIVDISEAAAADKNKKITYGELLASAPAGSAAAPSFSFDADPNTGIFNPAADTLAFAEGGAEVMRIDSSGRLLVGTSTATPYSGFSPHSIESTTFENYTLSIKANSTTALSTNSANIVLSRSGGSAVGSMTTVANGTRLSSLAFAGADGTNLVFAAAIECYVDGTPGTNDMPGRLVFSTTADGASSSTERLRITSAGNVGIGTSSPQHSFQVTSGTNFGAILKVSDSNSNSTGVIAFGDSTTTQTACGIWRGAANSYSSAGNALNVQGQTICFMSAGGIFGSVAEAARFDTSGRLGIGTSAPSEKLEINGALRVTGTIATAAASCLSLDYSSGAGRIVTYGADAGTQGAVVFLRSNSTAGLINESARIDTSGRLLVGTSTARANFSIGGTTYTPQTQLEQGVIQASFVRAASPYVALAHSNTVTSGSNTGNLVFFGNDGTNFIATGSISSEVDGTPGTADMPGRLVFSTTADGAATPTARLTIESTGRSVFRASTGVVYIETAAAAGTTNDLITGAYSSSVVSFRVYTNGNVVNTNNSYGAISDLKLKENIVDAGSQWDDLKALQVRKYNFKEGQTHTQIGLVAQEVELVSPGLVSESPDRDNEGNDLGTVTKSVNYSVLYMKAVKALQEAMERIETLEAKVTALESA